MAEKNRSPMLQTCLIAAHEPWIIQLLRIYSEESGFQVMQAFEGQDVLTAVQKEPPVVILLEYDLPGQIKGEEVLRRLKEGDASHAIPILVLSWQDQGMVKDSFEDSVAYLQEPVTYESFVAALTQVGINCPEASQAFVTGQDQRNHQNRPATTNKSQKRR